MDAAGRGQQRPLPAHRRAGRAGLGATRARARRGELRPADPDSQAGEWWQLPQEQRRAILEQSSRHIAVGLEYLPAVARRLHHSRDLHEPFDFLTWFEFAPEHAGLFDELTGRLRATEEWAYVDREVEFALERR